MKKILMLVSGLLINHAVMAEGGMINFTGAITEPACITLTHNHNATLHCSQNGVGKVRQITFNQQPQALPFQLGDVRVKASGHVKEIQVVYR
jgi:hypothetical protein